MSLDCFGLSETGMVRRNNQDAFGLFHRDETGLFIIADGMGGLANGEKASGLVLSELSGWWDSFSPALFGYDFSRMISSVVDALACANGKIYRQYSQNELCGTTATVLFLFRNIYGIIHAGDSRCYMLRRSQWKCLTMDEIWENQPGADREARMRQDHPNRGLLLNAVGVQEPFECRVSTDELKTDAVFLLCTDGIYKSCSDSDMKKCAKDCRKHHNMETAVKKLAETVYRYGARDNLTAAAIRYTHERYRRYRG